MRNRKKDKIGSILNKFKSYLLVFVSLFLIISLIRDILSIRKSEERIFEAKERVENLRAEKQELEERLDYYESDLYLETQLRNGLGLAKEDEIVIVLPEEEILRRIAPEIDQGINEDENIPNWKKWLNLFVMVEDQG